MRDYSSNLAGREPAAAATEAARLDDLAAAAAPAAAADDLARFLEADLDRAAMAASVDARLYRQRGGE